MTQDDLIKDVADSFKLPTNLVQAIVLIESNGNTWAVRYEQDFYARYVRGREYETYPGCSRITEGHMRACSFGLMQVMGQTARESGFKGTFLTELCDPKEGLHWGCRYLERQISRYGGDLESAVAAYNAGSARRVGGQFVNQGDVDKIRRAGGLA
jgi:soluble lytic murein transglycosylase-like protein